jgi:hypothetical protein
MGPELIIYRRPHLYIYLKFRFQSFKFRRAVLFSDRGPPPFGFVEAADLLHAYVTCI